jgi:hypothetical protein
MKQPEYVEGLGNDSLPFLKAKRCNPEKEKREAAQGYLAQVEASDKD